MLRYSPSCLNSGSNPIRFGARIGALSFLTAILVACNGSPDTTKLQYVPDMADGPQVKAQRDFLAPPEGSVTMNAILYPTTIEESEKVLKNPLPGGEEVIARGKVLFETFCAVCHGPDGKGHKDGENRVTDLFPPPPDITAESYLSRGDGFFFHKITFGGPIMPSLGHSISAHERWQIVHYLRTLQKPAGQQGTAPSGDGK